MDAIRNCDHKQRLGETCLNNRFVAQRKGSAGDDRSSEALGRHVTMMALVSKVNPYRRWCLCVR
jgi:hypothetical protein